MGLELLDVCTLDSCFACRYAVASALAASAVPALVMARGHRIDTVPELPLVVEDGVQNLSKTSKAVEMLKKLGCEADIERAKASRNLRRGKGKMRNRRYVTRKGPLIVYSESGGIDRAFRNLPGVDVQSVERLNLLQVCSSSSERAVVLKGPEYCLAFLQCLQD